MRLTIGPVLFHWPSGRLNDFYARIADEAPVDTVYLGETICSKRAPFFEDRLEEIAARLQRGGKQAVYSTLCEVMLKRERIATAKLCADGSREVEANDVSALPHLHGRAHRIGPMINVYNEETLSFLAERGAAHFTLQPEIPRNVVTLLAAAARRLGAGVEVQAFGRASLAVSARCYHARAHGRVKDNCQFVCGEDPDGMTLSTLDGADLLAVNGIQTLSHGYVNLLDEAEDMAALGVTDLRLSPHMLDMTAIAQTYRDRIDGRIDAAEAAASFAAIAPGLPVSNGFWHGRAGHLPVS